MNLRINWCQDNLANLPFISHAIYGVRDNSFWFGLGRLNPRLYRSVVYKINLWKWKIKIKIKIVHCVVAFQWWVFCRPHGIVRHVILLWALPIPYKTINFKIWFIVGSNWESHLATCKHKSHNFKFILTHPNYHICLPIVFSIDFGLVNIPISFKHTYHNI